MHQLLKRLLTPLALLLTLATNSAIAESIRLVGPDGELQSAPVFNQPVRNETTPSQDNATYYGPTAGNETLWSIASQMRPSRRYSVQQTLLAIYKLNPQAFENQNIHELIPGSRLRVPSLAQVQAESTNEAVRIMQLHEARLQDNKQVVATPVPRQGAIEEANITPPQPVKKPAEKLPEPVVQKKAASAEPEARTEKQKEQVNKLKQELTESEGELAALEEKNHQLRLMLSEVQNEVGSLKDELGDESRIRTEVEKLLEEERQRAADAKAMEPSQLDMLLANKWFVVLLALIPGLLFVLIVALILTRKGGKEVEEQEVSEGPEVISLIDDDDDIPEINLDDDIDDDVSIEDDLFGEQSDENIFDIEDEAALDPEDDIFANLDDSDLDFNLDEGEDDPFAGIADNGDFDAPVETETIDQSANGISVDGDERALSLEEMERALDEESSDIADEITSEFDLSDDGEMSQEELDELLSDGSDDEPLDGDELDQAALDELFGNVSDSSATSESTDTSESADTYESTMTSVMADFGDDDLDDFDLSSEEDASAAETTTDDIDDLLAEFQPNMEETGTGEPDSLFKADSTEFLDEIIDLGEDSELSDLNSTELLDELLEENEAEGDTPALAEDSTELLDELFSDLDESVSDLESLQDSTDLLDEFLSDDEPEISEDSTALLDEFLEEETAAEKTTAAEKVTTKETATEEAPSDYSLSTDPDDLLAEFGFEPESKTDEPAKVVNEPQEAQETTEEPADLSDKELEIDFASPEVDVDTDIAETEAEADVDADVEVEVEAEEVLSEAPQYDSEASETLPDLQEAEELPAQAVEERAEIEDSHQASTDVQAQTQDLDFDFSPHIEGSEHAEQIEELEDVESYLSEVEELQTNEPLSSGEATEAIPNEFGIPQDSDWELEQDDAGEVEEPASGPVSQEPQTEEQLIDQLFEDRGPMEDISEQAFTEISDEELPVYDEAAALEDFEAEPVTETEAADEISASEEPEQAFTEISDDELPVYDEAAALEDFEAEPVTETKAADEISASEEPEQAFSEISDDELPVYDEAAALEDFEAEPVTETAVADDISASEEPEQSFTEISDDELPVYDEAAALEDFELDSAPETEPAALDEFDQAFTEISDDELPIYDESAAFDDSESEAEAEPESDAETVSETEFVSEPEETEASLKPETSYDESASLAELLSGDGQPLNQSNTELDATRIDSAGMDLDVMLDTDGEDWNGFELSPEQKAEIPGSIPEEELAVWGAQTEEPVVQEEDWGSQSEEISEPVEGDRQFMSVDELMAQAEVYEENEVDPDEEELKLDVGLNEFPDVLGDVDAFDVDSNSEAAGKLDLAKIYIEMNDEEGAVRLLEEAMVYGEEDIRQEARTLLDNISNK